MLKEMIGNYRDTKMSIIYNLADQDYSLLEEPGFLDDGYLQAKVALLKRHYERIDRQIEHTLKYDKDDSYKVEKCKAMIEKRNDIIHQIVFFSSNSLTNLEDCERLLHGSNSNFLLCIKGLKAYRDHDFAEAFQCFYNFFIANGDCLDHYSINKVYGILLFQAKQYDVAAAFIRRAIEKRPEDLELHKLMIEIYTLLDKNPERKTHENILELLEDV
ncbi:MAG: hypothetical protein K0S47_4367 [Herbinix sp.]|jgi:tetratricopeptide (TPR) repeat protein|nr:hypothetical protein [Herbinix sp.]